jgi:uncharacterized protein (TIGR00255 family)
MIKSMTGFGRGKYQSEGVDILVEIKTFNHRYSDIYIKMPRQLSFLEDKVRGVVSGFVSRGKVEVFVTYMEHVSQSTDVFLDSGLADCYVSALKKLKDDYNLKDDISVSLVARFPDILKVQTSETDEGKLWDTLKIPLNEAGKSLILMRQYEGEKLAGVLRDRITCIRSYVDKIASRAPEIPKEYRAKLTNRIEEILSQQVVDETRMAMEIAIFADKCNVDEEIERLKSHTEQFLDLIEKKDPVGRKLDFLLQEMNREINTIGSKANDISLIKDVVEVKSEIEKIREQIQNIE